MTRKATIRDVDGALGTLAALLKEDLTLEREGSKVRIIRPDHSRPFGATWRTKADMYDLIWFAMDALRLDALRRQKENTP